MAYTAWRSLPRGTGAAFRGKAILARCLRGIARTDQKNQEREATAMGLTMHYSFTAKFSAAQLRSPPALERQNYPTSGPTLRPNSALPQSAGALFHPALADMPFLPHCLIRQSIPSSAWLPFGDTMIVEAVQFLEPPSFFTKTAGVTLCPNHRLSTSKPSKRL